MKFLSRLELNLDVWCTVISTSMASFGVMLLRQRGHVALLTSITLIWTWRVMLPEFCQIVCITLDVEEYHFCVIIKELNFMLQIRVLEIRWKPSKTTILEGSGLINCFYVCKFVEWPAGKQHLSFPTWPLLSCLTTFPAKGRSFIFLPFRLQLQKHSCLLHNFHSSGLSPF